MNGTEAPKTIRVAGNIYGQKPLMLIDSGSSSRFISENMALSKPTTVKVANGATVLSTHELKNCEIYIQGHCFTLNLKILPLKCYDVIIGMDWLEQHSLMKVHWVQKWMSFCYKGKKIKLQGLTPKLSQIERISVHQLEQLEQDNDIWCILEILQLKKKKCMQSGLMR